MIRSLKTEGALLNHIRPEFLLSFPDYNAYIRQLPKNITETMSPSALRIPSSRFQYLSVDAWTTLFYQILKVYYLSRVTPKNLKSIPGMPPEKLALPEYVEGSNLYSPNENTLLHWIET